MSPGTKQGSRSRMTKWRLWQSSPPSSTAIGTIRSSPAKLDDFIVSRVLTGRETNLLETVVGCVGLFCNGFCATPLVTQGLSILRSPLFRMVSAVYRDTYRDRQAGGW